MKVRDLMRRNKQNSVVFYTIKGSTIKKFVLLDCLTGTGLYFAIKLVTSSVLIGMVGCIVGTEGIKRVYVRRGK